MSGAPSAETGGETLRETRRYEAEVGQLLDLMVRSLYSNKEIFLRELISNASDAADRLRFAALSDDSLYEGEGDLAISIRFDREARTLTVADNGIGMSREEVIENVGTIARSGTRRFMESLTGDEAKDAQLIGQFGVGFYSIFIVADRVVLTTRRAGAPAGEGVRWESDGRGEFTVETVEAPARGTEVTLHLRTDEDDLLDGYRLRGIVRKYSDHISFPIRMAKEGEGAATDEKGGKAGEAGGGKAAGGAEGRAAPEEETVNRATALWGRPRQEISKEEYEEFYKHVAHDFEAPLDTVHARVEGNVEYTVLLYIPARAPFDLWDRNVRRGLRLYVRRVFILEDAGDLLPAYLRFVRGVIDSADLPLNVSREILQTNRQVDAIRSGTVRRVLGALDKLAGGDAEKYAKFWGEFGRVLKEGVIEDPANREAVARLLRFRSTAPEGGEPAVSFAAYVERMNEGQGAIYYLTADSATAARSSPHLEVFRERGVEVLLLTDPVDEWVVGHLTEFDGKPLRSVSRGDLDVSELGEKAADEGEGAAGDGKDAGGGKGGDGRKDEDRQGAGRHDALMRRIGEALGDRIEEVRVSRRLTTSPACLVAGEHALGAHFESVLRAAGQEIERSKPILEVNPDHPIVGRMSGQDAERFADWARILHDQALLSEGGQLEDPAGFVRRLNDMFQSLAAGGEAGGGKGEASSAASEA